MKVVRQAHTIVMARKKRGKRGKNYIYVTVLATTGAAARAAAKEMYPGYVYERGQPTFVLVADDMTVTKKRAKR